MISLRISIISRDNDNDSFEFNRDFARTERILKTLEYSCWHCITFQGVDRWCYSYWTNTFPFYTGHLKYIYHSFILCKLWNYWYLFIYFPLRPHQCDVYSRWLYLISGNFISSFASFMMVAFMTGSCMKEPIALTAY